MRTLALALTLAALSTLAACASNEQQPSNKGAANTASSSSTVTTTQTTNSGAPAATDDGALVAPAHGGGNSGAPASAPPASANPSASEQAGIDTSALDAKITKAEEKAHAANATQADKHAAAAAYMQRADIFMNAGRPVLYKYALRDYRRTLRYQPDNQQAQNSVKTIVDIYKSMGRPVPELGNEP
jgi:hypothetical protein